MLIFTACEIYFSPDVVLCATACIGYHANTFLVFRPAMWFSPE